MLPNLQVRDLVTVVIPLREVVLVEKVDNAASGELGTDSLVVTTKGKVHDLLIIHDLLYHTWFIYYIIHVHLSIKSSQFYIWCRKTFFFYLKDIMYNLLTVHWLNYYSNMCLKKIWNLYLNQQYACSNILNYGKNACIAGFIVSCIL